MTMTDANKPGKHSLAEIIQSLDLTLLTQPQDFSASIPTAGYTSDLLSCVMANAAHQGIWITLQAHTNIVAVAALLDLCAVIITEGALPTRPPLQKANQEGVVLLLHSQAILFMWLGSCGRWGCEPSKAPEAVGFAESFKEHGLRTFRADLHVHTVLSPCAGIEMIPPLIVEEALERGIRLIAITDHNVNRQHRQQCKKRRKTQVCWFCPGWSCKRAKKSMSCACFDELDQAQALQNWVDRTCPLSLTTRIFLANSSWWMKPAISSAEKNACCSPP